MDNQKVISMHYAKIKIISAIMLCLNAVSVHADTFVPYLDRELIGSVVTNILVMKGRLTNDNEDVRANLDLYVEGLQGAIPEDQTSMIKEIAMHGIDGLGDGFNFWNIEIAQIVYYNQTGDSEKLLEWASSDRGIIAASAMAFFLH
ncbi:MAG: hypothetical protein EOM12_07010 [Verrucomicrobiae bacterium]|nr:hypothetical protein [Verrucomicrobiae bacterium]